MTISKVTIKGQVIIPAQLRKKFDIKKGTRIAIMEGEGGAGLHVAESAVPSQTQHGETVIFLDNQA